MKRTVLALAMALLSAGCLAPAGPGTIIDPADAGSDASDAATAYPCGFVGSPMVDECHALITNGLPYCAHPDAGLTLPPFDDCRPVDGDEEPTWWCCPYQ